MWLTAHNGALYTDDMKLSDYLSSTEVSAEALAKRVGVTVSAVNFWRTGMRVPRIKQMQKIFDATGGKVGPSDFIFPEGEPAAIMQSEAAQ